MDTTFGIKGKDFVLLVADSTIVRSIFKLKETEDKIFTLNDNKLISIGGPCADMKVFRNHLQKNIELYKYRHGYELSTKETAHWTRMQCNRGRYGQVDSIIAGIDESVPQLFWLDYIGTMTSLNFAAHGYASYFLLGIFDNQYKAVMIIRGLSDFSRV